MDVLTELLPSSYTGKTESSSKDSRRHQPKHNQKINQKNDIELIEKKLNDKANVDKSVWVIERRSGDDRRQQKMDRGRWLESRDRKDRRSNPSTVFVKV